MKCWSFTFYWLEKERWPPSVSTMIAATGVAKKLGEEFCVKLTLEQWVWTKSQTPTRSIKNTDWEHHLKTTHSVYLTLDLWNVLVIIHSAFMLSTVSVWSSIRTVLNLGGTYQRRKFTARVVARNQRCQEKLNQRCMSLPAICSF